MLFVMRIVIFLIMDKNKCVWLWIRRENVGFVLKNVYGYIIKVFNMFLNMLLERLLRCMLK